MGVSLGYAADKICIAQNEVNSQLNGVIAILYCTGLYARIYIKILILEWKNVIIKVRNNWKDVVLL